LTQVLDRDGRLEDDNAPFVLVRLAKTLERELNAAKAELAELKKQSGLIPKRVSPLTIKRPPSRGTSNRRNNR
jgi:hypothetical protein